MSTIARWPATRKRAQPMMSGFQTRRSSWVGVRWPSSESARLTAKTTVPTKSVAAGEEVDVARFARHQRQRSPTQMPVAAAVRSVDREQHRGVAAGREKRRRRPCRRPRRGAAHRGRPGRAGHRSRTASRRLRTPRRQRRSSTSGSAGGEADGDQRERDHEAHIRPMAAPEPKVALPERAPVKAPVTQMRAQHRIRSRRWKASSRQPIGPIRRRNPSDTSELPTDESGRRQELETGSSRR